MKHIVRHICFSLTTCTCTYSRCYKKTVGILGDELMMFVTHG